MSSGVWKLVFLWCSVLNFSSCDGSISTVHELPERLNTLTLQEDSETLRSPLFLEFKAENSNTRPFPVEAIPLITQKLNDVVEWLFFPLSGQVSFLQESFSRQAGKPAYYYGESYTRLVFQYIGEYPNKPWMKDALMVRLRSAMMSSHHEADYEGTPHLELEAAREQKGNFQWYRTPRPHIIFAVSDDHGYRDCGWHKYNVKPSPTPNLDELRKESVEVKYLFTYPICSPSRASIWSGRFAHRHGYGPSINNGNKNIFPGRETLLSEILKGAGGYYNIGTEKWHLGRNEKRNTPLFRGFDSFMGEFSLKYKSRVDTFEINIETYENTVMKPEYKSARDVVTLLNATINPQVRESFEEESNSPVYTKEYLANIDSLHNVDILMAEQPRILNAFVRSDSRQKPLFWYVGFRVPHNNDLIEPAWNNYPKFVDETGWGSKRITYLRMIYAMDAQLQSLIDGFKQVGMWKDTVLIFMSDNTGLSNKLGGALNTPLSSRKNLVWDQRVINMFHGTASTLAPIQHAAFNTDNMDLMHSVDLLPTIATGIAKIPSENFRYAWKCSECLPAEDVTLDGINQWDSLSSPGGIDHIAKSKRMFATHVISQDQIRLQQAKSLKEIYDILPRHTWDKSFWTEKNDEYRASFRDFKIDPTSTAFLARVKEVACGFGTGYIQRGRYSWFFAPQNKLSGDPSLNPSDRRPIKSKNGFSRFSQVYSWDKTLPNPIPGLCGQYSAIVHDIVTDETRQYNLLMGRIPNEIKEAIVEMLRFYIQEQSPENSTIDTKLLYVWGSDPIEMVSKQKVKVDRPWCEQSRLCKYDMPITKTKGPYAKSRKDTSTMLGLPTYKFYR